MSMEICTFVPDIDDALIPAWLNRMDKIGMACEIHPGFSFFSHRGFLPFKLQLKHADNALLARQPYLTGFEFYLQPFDLSEQVKDFVPQQSVLDKLLGKKFGRIYFVSAAVDEKLSRCRYSLSFIWHGADIFEQRMATVSAAVIADLTGGICSFPADNIWYETGNLIEDCAKDAGDYENSLDDQEIKLYPFSDWGHKAGR